MKKILLSLVLVLALPAHVVLAEDTDSDAVESSNPDTSFEEKPDEVGESETATPEATKTESEEAAEPSVSTGTPQPAQEPVSQVSDKEMEGDGSMRTKRARNVFIGNILYIVGDVGSWSAMGMQIAGIVNMKDELYIAGLGVSIGFGTVRFSGLLTSGISATKLTKTTVADKFKWGYFIAGLVVGASRVTSTEVMMRTGNGSQEALIGIFVGSWVLQDLFWILHCVNAARLTKRYRASVSGPSYAVAPTIDPVGKTYGLAMRLSF